MLVIPRSSAPRLRSAVAIVAANAGREGGGGRGQRATLLLNRASSRSYSTPSRPSVLVSSSSSSSSSFPPRPSTSTSSFLLRFNSTTTSTAEPEPTLPTPTADPSIPSESELPTPPTAFFPPTEYPTHSSAVDAIASFQTLSPPATPEQYETLLSALTKHSSTSSTPITSLHPLSVYNQMLDLQIEPTQSSIANLILLLCAQDRQFNKVYNPQRAKPVDSKVKGRIGVNSKPDSAFSSAVALFRAALPRHLERKAVTFRAPVYEALLQSAVLHRDPQTAREIYLEMDKQSQPGEGEGKKHVKITSSAVKSLVDAFAFTNSGAVKVAFESSRGKERDGSLSLSYKSRKAVWLAAMKAYLLCGDVDAAKELFEQVVTAPRPSTPTTTSTTSPTPTDPEDGESTPTESASTSTSDPSPSIPASSSEPEAPTEPIESPPSSSPTSSSPSLDGPSSTSLDTISEPIELSPIPFIPASIALRDIFDVAPDQAQIRRDSLSPFLLHATSLPLPSLDIEATVGTAIGYFIKDGNGKQIVAALRLLHEKAPKWTTAVDLVGIQALMSPKFNRSRQFEEAAFDSAMQRVKRGRDLKPFPADTARDLVRNQASRRSSDEVANFHRFVLKTQLGPPERLETHKKVIARLLQSTLPPAERQLQTIVKVIAAARELNVREGHNFLSQYIGSFKDIYAKAKAQVGGDITRLNLTSSTVGSLFELLAAQDQQTRPSSSPMSRRPQMSLVEEFVQDLINAGDALESIAVSRRQASAARKILAESTGRAEASLLLEPFLEEPVGNENQLEEMEPAKEVVESKEEVEGSSVAKEGESAAEGEEVEPAEAQETEVIKIVRQVFDFEDAPWRSLIREGEGLVALLPTPPSSSISPDPTVDSPSDLASSIEVDDASPSVSSPQDEPLSTPESPTTDSTPSQKSSKSSSKSSKPRKSPKIKSDSKRSAQLLDARLQTLIVNTTPDSAVASYHCLRDILVTGHVPPFALISQVAESLGRRFEHQKVVEIVQLIEHVSEGGRIWDQSSAVRAHSEIISAFAYCRDSLSTEYHRTYLEKKMGAKATSSAYGALIFNGEDSTGNASYAVKLWKEARLANRSTHRHLYNGMMKAFGQVGKVEESVKILASMREGRATPSWASYGFAIEACLQDGQLEKAEELYRQMQRETLSTPRRDFKPSILPFTSLMQYYATKQKDRDALLRIDGDLRDLDLLSHSFTYEVLINAYGGIAPVEKNTMWDVMELLEANETQHAKVQGMHWAAMIRCLGVDDFDAAVSTFDGIQSRPSSFNKNPPLPDVVAYSAILEVAKSNDRQDVVEKYTKQMESSLIASTTKADLLIRTFAESKDIESARRVFESTLDEPLDLVRPLRVDPSQPIATVSSPIYRLGSTWNAIIQAELAQGNQAEAVALLSRMQAVEWKPNQRPIATIRQLGELLSVETNEEVETVEFDFAADLNAPRFVDLTSEGSSPAETLEIEAGEGEVVEAETEVEVVVVEEVVEVVEEVVEEREDASASKP